MRWSTHSHRHSFLFNFSGQTLKTCSDGECSPPILRMRLCNAATISSGWTSAAVGSQKTSLPARVWFGWYLPWPLSSLSWRLRVGLRRLIATRKRTATDSTCSSRDSNGDVAWVAESSSLTLEMVVGFEGDELARAGIFSRIPKGGSHIMASN